MELNATTKLDDLLQEYPFLLDFFLNRSPKFKMLQSAVMRKTVGKVATLEHIAARGGIELATLLAEIAAEIKATTGREPAVGQAAPESAAPAPQSAEARQEGS